MQSHLGFAEVKTNVVCPCNHILARSVSPRDIAPVDVLRMPLIEEVVHIPRWVVHRTARIVHPARGSQKMAVRPPACEERVVAHSLHIAGRQWRAALTTVTAATAATTGCRAGWPIARDGARAGMRATPGSRAIMALSEAQWQCRENEREGRDCLHLAEQQYRRAGRVQCRTQKDNELHQPGGTSFIL